MVHPSTGTTFVLTIKTIIKMKVTAIAVKDATIKIIITAKGEVSKNFRNALMCARFDATTNKIYPCSWMRSGRNFACRDKSALIISVLKAQGYKYEEGNDAPKGGLDGNYIKVSKLAFTFLMHYRKWN